MLALYPAVVVLGRLSVNCRGVSDNFMHEWILQKLVFGSISFGRIALREGKNNIVKGGRHVGAMVSTIVSHREHSQLQCQLGRGSLWVEFACSPCVCVVSFGCSLPQPKDLNRGNAKSTIGVSVNGCWSQYVGPAICWQSVSGAPHLSPNVSWDWLQLPPPPPPGPSKTKRHWQWMDLKFCCMIFCFPSCWSLASVWGFEKAKRHCCYVE